MESMTSRGVTGPVFWPALPTETVSKASKAAQIVARTLVFIVSPGNQQLTSALMYVSFGMRLIKLEA